LWRRRPLEKFLRLFLNLSNQERAYGHFYGERPGYGSHPQAQEKDMTRTVKRYAAAMR